MPALLDTPPDVGIGEEVFPSAPTRAPAAPSETTRLTPADEQSFQQWTRANKITGVDDPDSHYDMRGFWQATGGAPHPPGSEQHFPDTFKQHGHPTFSVESKYSSGPNDGGHWNGDTFVPPHEAAIGEEVFPSAAVPPGAQPKPLAPPGTYGSSATAPVPQGPFRPPPVAHDVMSDDSQRFTHVGVTEPPPPPPAFDIDQKTGQKVARVPYGALPVLDSTGAGVSQIAKGAAALGRQLAHPAVLPADAHVMQGQPGTPAQGSILDPGFKMPVPGPDEVARNAASDLIEGFFTTAQPIMVGGAITAPVLTAIGVAKALVGQYGAAQAVKKLGGDESAQRLVGNIVAAGSASITGRDILAEINRTARPLVLAGQLHGAGYGPGTIPGGNLGAYAEASGDAAPVGFQAESGGQPVAPTVEPGVPTTFESKPPGLDELGTIRNVPREGTPPVVANAPAIGEPVQFAPTETGALPTATDAELQALDYTPQEIAAIRGSQPQPPHFTEQDIHALDHPPAPAASAATPAPVEPAAEPPRLSAMDQIRQDMRDAGRRAEAQAMQDQAEATPRLKDTLPRGGGEAAPAAGEPATAERPYEHATNSELFDLKQSTDRDVKHDAYMEDLRREHPTHPFLPENTRPEPQAGIPEPKGNIPDVPLGEEVPPAVVAQAQQEPPIATPPTAGLPDYAVRAVYETSMGRRTNEGGSISAPDPYAGGSWVQHDVPLATITANPRNKNLGTAQFTARGSQTKGPIVIDDRGEVIDGNNRVHEALARGETTIPAYVFEPPAVSKPPAGAAANYEVGERAVVDPAAGGGIWTITAIDGDQVHLAHNDGRTQVLSADQLQGKLAGVSRPVTPQVPHEPGTTYVLPSFVTGGKKGQAPPTTAGAGTTGYAPGDRVVRKGQSATVLDPAMKGDKVRVKVDGEGFVRHVEPSALARTESLPSAPEAPTVGVGDAVFPTPADVQPGPGRLPERGESTAGGDRTGSESPLGAVQPEAGGTTPEAGPAGAGHGDSSGVLAPGVPDRPGAGGEPETAPTAGGGDVSGRTLSPAGDAHDPGPKPPDYALTPERVAAITKGGTMTRARHNLAAIELVKRLIAEKRYATPDEQETLSQYVGFGESGLADFLADTPDRDWKGTEREVWQGFQDATTPDERAALAASSTNAHFTFGLYAPIWAALARAGFTGGRVLEPAVGTGHAFGFMPAEMRAASTLNGVELEPLTASIAQALYPSARIQPVGYERSRIARGTQDLVISNVPFANSGVQDPLFKPFLTDRIHNYFFAKALEHVRPGGLIVFITSRYTMDNQSEQVRRYLTDHARFLGAVRLPNTAFDKSAKTEVITDLIVLQRKARDEELGPAWVAEHADLFLRAPRSPTLSSTQSTGYGRHKRTTVKSVYRSAWYDAHPELVLGTETLEGKQYGAGEYTVTATGADVLQALETGLGHILPPGSYTPATTEATAPQTAAVATDAFKPGELRIVNKNVMRVDRDGTIVDATPMRMDRETGKSVIDVGAVSRITGMVAVRDALRATVAAMKSDASTERQILQAQVALSKAYNAFVKQHGRLNDPINKRVFSADPEVTNLTGLERFTPAAKLVTDRKGHEVLRTSYTFAGLADIFTKRTLHADKEITAAATPQDALLASLGSRTRIDWPYMARITGQPVEALQQALREERRVYEQPDGSWALAEEYLSGDVVSKLADAEAAHEPTRFAGNLEALKAIQPVAKQPEDITIALGSHWVDPKYVAAYIGEELGVPPSDTTIHVTGTEAFVRWTLAFSQAAVRAGDQHPLAVRYGPDAGLVYNLTTLIQDALNLSQPTLGWWEGHGDDRHFVKDPTGTLAARSNLEEIRTKWLSWLFQHPDVRTDLLQTYNTRFNRTVERTFDGSHLVNIDAQGQRTSALPGLALPFALFPHQLRAIWRILTTGNTLLAHEVGAGKTYEMIVAAMEMRRTGRARKPMITVPTYLLGQWRDAIATAYPTAKVLAFDDKDLSADKRQQGMAKIAFGDWDIVLVPHSSFQLLKVSDARMNAVMQSWITELLQAEAEARTTYGKDDQSVKKLAAVRKKIENKVAKKAAKVNKGTDNALTWEQLGVDALMVDEAQAFKNLFFFSKIDALRGLSRSESDRSLDMFVKVMEINEQSHYRNLVLATATPIMNSIAELFTMQRYLQPQRLEEQGLENFDNWYAMFAHALPTTEQRPDGTYQEVMRLRKYRNLDLLYRTVSEVMDYVGWDDMPYLKLPKLKGGRVRIVQTEPHPLYPQIKQWFSERLDRLRANPPYIDRQGDYHAPDQHDPLTGHPTGRKDNIITVMTHAKLAAVDVRLILGKRADDVAGSRVQVAARDIATIYRAERAKKGVILLFLDVGTPKDPPPLEFLKGAGTEDQTGGGALGVEEEDGILDENVVAQGDVDQDSFNLYDALKAALVTHGIPSREIAYIHQARNAAERLALFQAANEGTVRVLFASTDKGGIGMNIQTRLAAIEHIDAPRAMRPGDIRQRDGRGIRQGNTYPEIDIARYVTKGTTDEWLYGLLGQKSTAITQFMHGNLSEYEDDDPSTMSIEEAQIRATNDPRGIELTQLRAASNRLEAQATAAERAIGKAHADIATETARAKHARADLKDLQAWLTKHFVSMRGDAFRMTVGGADYTSRADANKALMAELEEVRSRDGDRDLGTIGALTLHTTRPRKGDIAVWLEGAPTGSIYVTSIDIPKAKELPIGEGRNLVQSILSDYDSLPGRAATLEKTIETSEATVQRATQLLAHPPEAIEKVRQTKARIAELEAELKGEGAAKDAAAAQARGAAPAPAALSRAVATPTAGPPRVDTADVRARARILKVYALQPIEVVRAELEQLETGELAEWPPHFPPSVLKSYDIAPVEGQDLTLEGEVITGHVKDLAIQALHYAALQREGQQGLDFTDVQPKGRAAAAPIAQAAIIPGAAQFLARDVTPALRAAFQDAGDAHASIRALWAPDTVSGPAETMATVMRPQLAVRRQRDARARKAMRALEVQFDKIAQGTPRDQPAAGTQMAFAMAVDEGRIDALPAWQQPVARMLAEINTRKRNESNSLGGKVGYIKDYFPREWLQPGKVREFVLRALYGKRPLQGRASFKKARARDKETGDIYSFRHLLAAGFEPVASNPITAHLRKWTEMDKWIAAKRILIEGKEHGVATFVKIGEKPTEGWKRYPDSFGTVYGPPVVQVKQAYDANLMEAIHTFAAQLGIRMVRKVQMGGQRWGYTIKAGAQGAAPSITTRFGGPEGVLMHEIGHVLDNEYGLGEQIGLAQASERHEEINFNETPSKVRKELRELADLRADTTAKPSFKKYIRQRDEVIANLVHAFLYVPEKAKAVAPTAYWALYNLTKDNPDLRGLFDIQKARSLRFGVASAEIPVGGLVVKGYYYGPPDAVRLLENHLSPGLRGHLLFDLYRRAGNFLNQVQLGLSLFHVMTTSVNSTVSRGALGLEQFSRGQVLQGAKSLALAHTLVLPPLLDVILGNRLLKAFYAKDANFRGLVDAGDLIVRAGGGVGWDTFWHNSAPERFLQAFRGIGAEASAGNYPGAALRTGATALRAFPAAVEMMAKPIMEHWVPRLKLAAFWHLAMMELRDLGPQPDQHEVDKVLGKAWDSIDNRFGELIYDNLFWNAILKDAGMGSVRALGWNLGTVREVFGAIPAQLGQMGVIPGAGSGGGFGKPPMRLRNTMMATDPAGGPDIPVYERGRAPWLSHPFAYFVALVYLSAVMGALYQKLHTGLNPGEQADGSTDPSTALLDLYFPRTGGMTRDGRPDRATLWTYMKDVFAFLRHPITTIEGKVNPILSLTLELIRNEDYFGTAMRNPDDPLVQQLEDVVKYLATQYRPISAQSFLQRAQQRGGLTVGTAAESLLGVNVAPRSATRTALEDYLHEIQPPSHRSQADEARLEARRALRDAVQDKDDAARRQAIAGGLLTRRAIGSTLKAARFNALQLQFRSTTLDQAVHAYTLGTPEERLALKAELLMKRARLLPQVAPTSRQAMQIKVQAALALPAAARAALPANRAAPAP